METQINATADQINQGKQRQEKVDSLKNLYEEFLVNSKLPFSARPRHKFICFLMCLFPPDLWGDTFKTLTGDSLPLVIKETLQKNYYEKMVDKSDKETVLRMFYMDNMLELIKRAFPDKTMHINIQESGTLGKLVNKVETLSKKYKDKYYRVDCLNFYILMNRPQLDKSIKQVYGYIPTDLGQELLRFSKGNIAPTKELALEWCSIMLERAFNKSCPLSNLLP